jgi:undecaprenyl-diphosphatase
VIYVHAAILGILEGLTEFLPVSSTAHLLIGERLLGFADPGGIFTVVIQFGAVLAVVWLYRVKLLRVTAGLLSDPDSRRFALMLVLAFIPAAVAGLLLAKFIKSVLYETPVVFAWAFIVGGIVMLLVERYRPKPEVFDAERTSPVRAFGVGVFQMLALIPGASRSGSTIVGGMLMGLDRPAAAEFSFFLAIPTMAAAFAHDLWEVRHELAPERGGEIAIGFVFAFLAALVVVRPFLRFVGRSGFGPFAWYRVAAGILILAGAFAGVL